VPLAFISNSRVSMQRAGMLVAACLAASDEVTGMDRVTRRFAEIVRREVPVDADDLERVDAYLRSLRLWKRYGRLRAVERISVGERIELQDLWLSDERLPSATGAITAEVIEDIPQLAIQLRTLRVGNLTRTDRARALLASFGDGKLTDLAEGSARQPNLLILPTGAQLIIAYALLEADGDFLRSAWATTPVLEQEEWTRADFATGLREACEHLADRARRSMLTGADRQAITRLREWAQEIAKGRSSGKNWGGGRPPDQLATLRLEPFVDLGLITRSDRASYRYRLNSGQLDFFRSLGEIGSVERYAREHLVQGWLGARGEQRRRADEAEIWEYVCAAYDSLKSRLGFAPFVEVVLLAIGRMIDDHRDRYFEIQQGVDVITEQRRANPKRVRLTISRGGQLTYMKIAQAKKVS
jgi:hypothetical protein